MIFVDTSAWYAAMVPTDKNHASAFAWFEANNTPVVTTDYIVDELVTLLDRRGESQRSALARKLLLSRAVRLEFVGPHDFFEAWDVHDAYTDKLWSFTDCTSQVIMKRLAINIACSFDQHFRQFGTVRVVP
jgi:uncharacterized protein